MNTKRRHCHYFVPRKGLRHVSCVTAYSCIYIQYTLCELHAPTVRGSNLPHK